MGTTSKMAIPYPEATGLVKDGWEDMKDIANQVDAKSGLVLLNTTAFSAVASQSINDVFNASFDNYKIVISQLTTSVNLENIALRLRVSSTDNTSSNYTQGRIWVGAYASTALGSSNNFTTTSFTLAQNSSTVTGGANVDIFQPFLSKNTAYKSHGIGTLAEIDSGIMTVTTSYTGFTIIAVSGTMTGSVSVYGYNK